MEKTNSLGKAILFSVLIILLSAVVQALLTYFLEYFSKLTLLIPLLGSVLAFTVFIKYYSKAFVINGIWIILLTFVLNVLGSVIAESLILSETVENMDLWGAITQFYCAVFKPENVSEIFNKAEFVNAVKSDLIAILAFNFLGCLIALGYLIGIKLKQKKEEKMYQQAVEQQNQAMAQQQSEERLQQENQTRLRETCEDTVMILARIIKEYNEDKNEEKYQERLKKYDKYLEKFQGDIRQTFFEFAKRNTNSKNTYIKQECEYIVKKLSQ